MSDDNGGPSPATTVVLPGITGAAFPNGWVQSVAGKPAATSQSKAGPADPPSTSRATASRTVAPRGHSLRSFLAVVAAGMVLGGLTGGLIAASTAGGKAAGALVELIAVQDPGLAAADPAVQSSDTLATFVASEFAQLSSDGFQQAVAEKVGTPDAPEIEVSRVGTSSVVRFSATGDTDAAGVQVVQAAVELYTQQRTDAARQQIANSIASIDRTLRDVDAPPVDLNEPDQSRQARVDRLLALRADLLLLSYRDQPPVRVLQPPSVSDSSPTSPWLLGTVLGSVAGGLLAVGASTLRRSRSTTILTAADAETVTDRVLHPELRLPRDWESKALPHLLPPDRRVSRLLVAQIQGQRPLSGRLVAVVAASPASASGAVAATIATGAAEQTSTLLVDFGATPETSGTVVGQTDGLTIVGLSAVRSDPGLDTGWTTLLETISAGRYCVVIDVGTALEVLRLLPLPVEVVMALGLGVDSKPDSAALASAIPGGTGSLLGVVTRRPWHQRWRLSGRARLHE